MPESADIIDCLIIGGGPAGLTAAIYLARYRRNVAVIDSGASRAMWIPVSHNYPGFAAGISGPDLLEKLRQQAHHYGVTIRQGEVTGLTRDAEIFRAVTANESLRARSVLLATGIVDTGPSFAGLADLVRNGAIRYCPVCDGFEATDRRVGVMGTLDMIVPKGLFLRTYTEDVILLATDKDIVPAPGQYDALKAAGIMLPRQPLAEVVASGDHVTAIMADGAQIELDILYPALGAHVRSELAVALGAEGSDIGCLHVNAHQETAVPGLYAAGDVTFGLSQISVATGQAAIAATAIHNMLPANPRQSVLI